MQGKGARQGSASRLTDDADEPASPASTVKAANYYGRWNPDESPKANIFPLSKAAAASANNRRTNSSMTLVDHDF
jgi:hypothetical protein